MNVGGARQAWIGLGSNLQGTWGASPDRQVAAAMRAIDRLPMIIDALTEAYDLVIVECGAADAASVARIARAERGEIVLSILRSDEAEVAEMLAEFNAQGFADVLLMTPGQPVSPLGNRSTAA